MWQKTLPFEDCEVEFQSTHLHEVWPIQVSRLDKITKFQSTHLHEVWRFCWFLRPLLFFLFQSTHLHEVWLGLTPLGCIVLSFNPHTYMRCDIAQNRFHSYNYVSIHTPTWGVTTSRVRLRTLHAFQSTHLHEVWLRATSGRRWIQNVSIHTPTWGVTEKQQKYSKQ